MQINRNKPVRVRIGKADLEAERRALPMLELNPDGLLQLNPEPGEPERRRTHLARIKAWTRELLRLDHTVPLIVREVRCPEPDCPDVETVVGIGTSLGHWRRLKIAKPAAFVTRDDLAALIG